jgi:hypothetical protein
MKKRCSANTATERPWWIQRRATLPPPPIRKRSLVAVMEKFKPAPATNKEEMSGGDSKTPPN